MVQAVDFEHGLGRKELMQVRRRFQALHQQRLKKLEDDLSSQQKDFLQIIPLLFHINHSALPGYVCADVPAGLPDYHPDRQTLLVAKKFSRAFEYEKRALRSIPVEALYLMGSVGTIGQSVNSDLDFWLCHAHNLTDEEKDLLQKKAELIEKVGMDYGLEVHFFLMDAVAFKMGQKLKISSESSGSTQHYLLLEEFYRSAILVAGRAPMWWLVPVEEEYRYNDYVQMLIDKRFIDSYEFVDFGGMQHIPPQEFFGAAHWQLYKGIESPYKAILKIVLMEAYTADFPEIPWLCLVSKKAVFEGSSDELLDIDPYLLIYRQVESYLISRGHDERLELARRCFYFKVNLPLSRMRRNNTHWRTVKLKRLVEEWGWSDGELATLDARDNWKLEKVLRERNILVRELSHSYRVLMNFARNNAATAGINPVELNLLGRKLYAALEKRPGKIDFINPGISRDLLEQQVCFSQEKVDGMERWSLYRRSPDNDPLAEPLKTTVSLLELIAWCYCNKVINRNVQILLRPENCPVTINEIRQMIDKVRQIVVLRKKSKPDIADLGKKAVMIFSSGFVNIGIDPLEKFSRAGLQLTSSQTDALSYSATHMNLAQRIEQLSLNSWGEIEVHAYQDSEGVLESLCRFLQSMQQSRKRYYQQFLGFGGMRSQSIASRLGELVEELVNCFFKSGPGLQSRYLMKIDRRIACIEYNNNNFNYLLFDSNPELYEFLGDYHVGFRPVVFDPLVLADHPLPVIYSKNRKDIVQLFCWKLENGTQLFVLDESGALFFQFVKNADPSLLMVQQQRFLKSLFDRQALLSADAAARQLFYHPEYFRVEKKNEGNWKVSKTQLPMAPVIDEYIDLQLIVGSDPDTLSSYSIMCGDREFDYLILANEIYTEVAAYVLRLRRDAATYPVYLTAIAPSSMDDSDAWSTIRLLNFKKRLETQINVAMEKLARERGL